MTRNKLLLSSLYLGKPQNVRHTYWGIKINLAVDLISGFPKRLIRIKFSQIVKNHSMKTHHAFNYSKEKGNF